MQRVTVVAKVVAKQSVVAAVKAELLKLVAPTRQENGCIEYLLHQDNNDPAVFIFYETWESQTCLEDHLKSDHFNSYIAAVDNLLEEKTVHLLSSCT